jgi:hypothetical protein
MTSLDEFWDEFQVKFSRAPVWLPGTKMQLGDIGKIDRRGFIRIANLRQDYGIAYEEQPSSVDSEYYVSSANATSRDFDAGGSAPGAVAAGAQLEAGMQISFEAEKAFVVRAKGVRAARIENVLAVEDEIRQKKFWRRNWIYVQEVVTAQPCILIVSASSGGGATIKAATSGGLVGFGQLLEAGAKLRVDSQSALDQCFVSSDRAALMWRGRWLRRWKFHDLDRDTADDGPSDAYEDFDDPTQFEREIGEDEPAVSDPRER